MKAPTLHHREERGRGSERMNLRDGDERTEGMGKEKIRRDRAEAGGWVMERERERERQRR